MPLLLLHDNVDVLCRSANNKRAVIDPTGAVVVDHPDVGGIDIDAGQNCSCYLHIGRWP